MPSPICPPKAEAFDFLGRFREIVADPLNLMIHRDGRAGTIEGDLVYLHNGLKVPCQGEAAYYGNFSDILVINRGVHEPLEEFVFQEVLKVLPQGPTMLELGAYWGHYSMWLKAVHPQAQVCLVEPDANNIRTGQGNFALNGFQGEFIQAFVGAGQFGVDTYLTTHGIEHLSILHADIQGYELEMLADCAQALSAKKIDFLFISTHAQALHQGVLDQIQTLGYRLEVAADFDCETTSHDGFVFASSPYVEPVFPHFLPLGREQILTAQPQELVRYLVNVVL